MFDLEKSVAIWRRQMLAAGIKTPVPLEELETHLREEIASQVNSGLSEQNAFEVALEKIGPASPLQHEFKKISTGDKLQRQKKVAGIVSIVIFGFYASVVSGLLLEHEMTSGERLLGFASVAALLLSLFVVWRVLPGYFPIIQSKAVQSAIGIIGGVSGMVWVFVFAEFVLPRCNFTQGPLLVAVLWAFVPMLLLPATAFMVIDKSERQPTAAPHS
jgi:hypothetical protein